MAVTAELTILHRTLEELRRCVGDLRSRYGDIPPVRRIIGDVDRINLDASELDEVPVPDLPIQSQEMHVLDDTPPDPALWADADDEGIGGYRGTDPGRGAGTHQ
jgi:hypothetical protein